MGSSSVVLAFETKAKERLLEGRENCQNGKKVTRTMRKRGRPSTRNTLALKNGTSLFDVEPSGAETSSPGRGSKTTNQTFQFK